MFGKIFITRQGYDPARGKHVKDPYLGDNPSIGACRPDVRKQIKIGGQVFIISGKIPELPQFVLGGLEVAEKMSMRDAYQRFPEQHLHRRDDGELEGNIIMDGRGRQHKLDNHSNFKKRIDDYVVGRNPISLVTEKEIALGRQETLDALRDIIGRKGKTPYEVVGHYGRNLDEEQAAAFRAWLESIKKRAA
jgi:hypothetical protein